MSKIKMIIEKIKNDKVQARKNKDTAATKILSLVMSELDRKQKYTDVDTIKVIKDSIKNNKLMLEHQSDSDKIDLLSKEIAILEKYLPEQFTTEEINKIVNEFVTANGPCTMQHLGKLMKQFKESGKDYDGAVVSIIFKQQINI